MLSRSLVWSLKQHIFTIINKKQLPEVFYKKAVHKNFSIFPGKYLCSSLFLMKLRAYFSWNLTSFWSETYTDQLLLMNRKLFRAAGFSELLIFRKINLFTIPICIYELLFWSRLFYKASNVFGENMITLHGFIEEN